MSLTFGDSEGLLWEVEAVRRWRSNNAVGALINEGWYDQEERRPVSLADLVEVLKQEGATIEVVGEPGYAEKDGWVEPGSYLVLLLGDTP